MKIILVCSLALGLFFALSFTPTKSLMIQFAPAFLDEQYCPNDGFKTHFLEVHGNKMSSFYKNPLNPDLHSWLQLEEYLIYQSINEVFIANYYSPLSSKSFWYKLIPLKVSPTGFLESFSYQGELYSIEYCEQGSSI